jgi:alkylation response protein AidB-like acyl-CoA dehydrogenase
VLLACRAYGVAGSGEHVADSDRDKRVALATTLDDFVPRIAQAADAIDDAREIPPELAAAMADAGLFRLLLPADLDGSDTPYPAFVKAVQAIAEADGSTGWCVNQGNVWATYERGLPDETRHEIWDEPRAVIANGPPLEESAQPVDGGHILSGRWWFSSGSPHATWLAAQATDMSGAEPEVRLFLLPKSDAELPDTWHVAGLRGTGSHEFRVHDLFVPLERSFPRIAGAPARPLHAIPTSLLFAGGFAAVALGVARASLDFALDLAEDKAQRFERNPLRDQVWVQDRIGHAETRWRAANSFLHTTVAETWDSALVDWRLSDQELALLRMAATDAIRQAEEVVDLAYVVVGTDGIFQDRSFQRRYQDMKVITQHVQSRMTHYESLGKFFLGLGFNADSL